MHTETGESIGLRISKPFGRKLTELAGIRKGNLVLDIGTGLGPVFFPALERVGPDGGVVGVDISDEMVKGTHILIKKYTYCNAAIIKSDAKNLIFRKNTFDVVLCGFSYIYSSLKEIKRVLKSGRQFGLSSWTALGDMDCMVHLVKRYLPISREDVYHRDTPKALKTLLHKAGFNDIRVFAETHEFVFKDEEQWWEEMLNSGWQPYLTKIKDLGHNLVEFKKETFEKLQVQKHPEGIPFTMSALLAFGTKSSSK